MKFQDVILSGHARRIEALEEARCAGRLGAVRLPLALSTDPTVSDTFIGKLTAALEEGRRQRQEEQSQRGLLENAERLVFKTERNIP